MEKNVGFADSYIRVLIGVALLLNIFILKLSLIGTVILLVLGCSILFSAFSRFCGVYKIFKISTCKEQ